jgi:hypothetical protein
MENNKIYPALTEEEFNNLLYNMFNDSNINFNLTYHNMMIVQTKNQKVAAWRLAKQKIGTNLQSKKKKR